MPAPLNCTRKIDCHDPEWIRERREAQHNEQMKDAVRRHARKTTENQREQLVERLYGSTKAKQDRERAEAKQRAAAAEKKKHRAHPPPKAAFPPRMPWKPNEASPDRSAIRDMDDYTGSPRRTHEGSPQRSAKYIGSLSSRLHNEQVLGRNAAFIEQQQLRHEYVMYPFQPNVRKVRMDVERGVLRGGSPPPLGSTMVLQPNPVNESRRARSGSPDRRASRPSFLLDSEESEEGEENEPASPHLSSPRSLSSPLYASRRASATRFTFPAPDESAGTSTQDDASEKPKPLARANTGARSFKKGSPRPSPKPSPKPSPARRTSSAKMDPGNVSLGMLSVESKGTDADRDAEDKDEEAARAAFSHRTVSKRWREREKREYTKDGGTAEKFYDPVQNTRAGTRNVITSFTSFRAQSSSPLERPGERDQSAFESPKRSYMESPGGRKMSHGLLESPPRRASLSYLESPGRRASQGHMDSPARKPSQGHLKATRRVSDDTKATDSIASPDTHGVSSEKQPPPLPSPVKSSFRLGDASRDGRHMPMKTVSVVEPTPTPVDEASDAADKGDATSDENSSDGSSSSSTLIRNRPHDSFRWER